MDKQESNGEEFGRGREEFCQLDDLNCAVLHSPVKKSPGPGFSSSSQKSPTIHCKVFSLIDDLNCAVLHSSAEISPAQVTSSSQKFSTSHSKVSMAMRSSEPSDTSVLNLNPGFNHSRSLFFPSPALSSSVPSSPCICYRPQHVVTCSSPSCGHSFYGRVAIPCLLHPTDHCLMDHPTICPKCQTVSLVEDMKLTLHKECLTKINSTPLPMRKEATTSPGTVSCVEDRQGRQLTIPIHVLQIVKSDKTSHNYLQLQQTPSTVPRLAVANRTSVQNWGWEGGDRTGRGGR